MTYKDTVCFFNMLEGQTNLAQNSRSTSQKDPRICNALVKRLISPPTLSPWNKGRKWEVVFEMVSGLFSNLGKKENHSVGCPNVVLVYESFTLTTIVHPSHFISKQLWVHGTAARLSSVHMSVSAVGRWWSTSVIRSMCAWLCLCQRHITAAL